VIPLMPGITCSEAPMMARQSSDQASLFYEFGWMSVPKDHLLRHINVLMTPVLGGVHEHLKSYYSEIGRPSIDPEFAGNVALLTLNYFADDASALAAGAHRSVSEANNF
jgi:hypothetical protein